MGEYATPISAQNSDNDWFACVQLDECGYIGVRPNGVNESCPDCGSGLERYGGRIYECADCGTEYVGQGDAEDCCR